ncbi:MAG: glycosyltransferase family 25 protein [Roseovarius sp.]|nr:glycosyltransferase family 25 protein [Roseovarius sp.]
MNAKAFILHLGRARSRNDNVQHLLELCGIEAEVWPAVDGESLSESDIAATVKTGLFKPAYPFDLGKGEIGCFLSHRQVWLEMLKRNLDAALIFEDDAGIDPNTYHHALKLAFKFINQMGYIQLQTRRYDGPRFNVDIIGHCAIVVPRRTELRSTAQMVSREAALKLLYGSSTFDRPVDTYVQSHWHTGVRPAMIYPSGIISNSRHVGGSTVQNARKTFSGKVWREASRFIYRSAVTRYSKSSSAPIHGGCLKDG